MEKLTFFPASLRDSYRKQPWEQRERRNGRDKREQPAQSATPQAKPKQYVKQKPATAQSVAQELRVAAATRESKAKLGLRSTTVDTSSSHRSS
jgi:hypothetical protein